MNQSPTVSIILAAYNRAEVMRFAIQSVLQSDFEQWELIIIGDGCTDDSQAVAASFGDPRITFENLPANSGGQAAPNNRGIELAKGRYILFLNQDDLYLPGHIGQAVAHLDETGADVSWCPVILLQHSGKDTGPPDPDVDRLILDGAVDDLGYDPSQFYVASSWALRREACQAVGPWLPESDCRVTPSQNWLFRAVRAGQKVVYRRTPSVIAIHAGARKGSYVSASPEHARVWSWISQGPEALLTLFAATLSTVGSGLYKVSKHARSQMSRQISEIADYHGVHTTELTRFLAGEATGDYIRSIKALTYNAPELCPDQPVNVGSNLAEPYLGSGWHPGEVSHRWTAARQSELVFMTSIENGVLHLDMNPGQLNREMRIHVNGVLANTTSLQGARSIQVNLGPGSGRQQVVLEVDNTVSPKELGIGADTRMLGLALRGFCLRRA